MLMTSDDLPHQERLTDEELTKYKQGISEMWRVDDVAIRILANPSGGRATRFLYALGAVLSDLYREKQARGWPLIASDYL